MAVVYKTMKITHIKYCPCMVTRRIMSKKNDKMTIPAAKRQAPRSVLGVGAASPLMRKVPDCSLQIPQLQAPISNLARYSFSLLGKEERNNSPCHRPSTYSISFSRINAHSTNCIDKTAPHSSLSLRHGRSFAQHRGYLHFVDEYRTRRIWQA